MKKKSIALFGGYVFIYILLAAYHGLIPCLTFPSLGINYILLSNVNNFSNMITDSALYPYGALSFEGYGIILIGNFFNLLVNNSEIALSCTYLFFYSLAFGSLVILGMRLLKKHLLTVVMLIVYFLNPFLNAQLGIPYMAYGTMLTAFSILLDYIVYNICQGNYSKKKKNFALIIVFFGRLLLVSVGWYTGVITAVFSCLTFLVFYVIKFSKKKSYRLIVEYLVFVVLPWFISMLVTLLITPSGASDFSFSLEWANAASVDIMTLLLPRNTQLISHIIPAVDSFLEGGERLYGDSTMWSNYLGCALAIGAFTCIFTKDSRTSDKHIKIAVSLAGLVGLILAMGPGIKIFGTYQGDIYDYTMPLEKQILFPWRLVYSIFPFSTMRAVYRWLLIDITALFFLAFWGFKKLWERGGGYKIFTIILCCVAVFEYYPSQGFKYVVEDKVENATKLQSFKKDVIEELRPLLNAGDLIAFCNYATGKNGYLVAFMMEELDTIAYVGGGDKAISTASPYVPSDICLLQESNDPQQIAYSIAQAFDKGLCDAVLLPFFDTREDSYTWKPSEETIDSYKKIADGVVQILGDQYQISSNKFFVLIQPQQVLVDNAYELICDESLFDTMKHDSNSLFGTYKSLCLNSEAIFEKELSIEDEQEKIFVNFYLSGRDSFGQLVCEEYDINDKLIGYQNLEINVTPDWEKYEATISLKEATKRVTISLLPEDILYLKNIIIKPYRETFDVLEYPLKCSGNNSVQISNVTADELSYMSLVFDAKITPTKDGSMINKMEGWCNSMSYDILTKGDYIVFAFSEDGSTNHNIYIEKELVNLEDWNHYDITFSDGHVTVDINGKNYANEQLNIFKLFGSNMNVVVGEELIGEIANLEYKYY